MIVRQQIYMPAKDQLYDKVIKTLMEEYGLVPAIANGKIVPEINSTPRGGGRVRRLVWEDETGIGRYRVHCFENHAGNGKDSFCFTYWTNDRASREILEKDPMKQALDSIISLSQEVEVPDALFGRIEFTVDEIMKGVKSHCK